MSERVLFNKVAPIDLHRYTYTKNNDQLTTTPDWETRNAIEFKVSFCDVREIVDYIHHDIRLPEHQCGLVFDRPIKWMKLAIIRYSLIIRLN